MLKRNGPLPDHVLVPVVQHLGSMHQSSSGIRSRRAELVAKGRARDTGRSIITASGRSASVFEAIA